MIASLSSTIHYIKTSFSHAVAGKLVGIDLEVKDINKKTVGARDNVFVVKHSRSGLIAQILFLPQQIKRLVDFLQLFFANTPCIS